MPFPKIIPALADLTQDIAGQVPVQLLHDWATGAQDLTAAETLLKAFETEGTVVSTDTSGLSRMTQAMDLLDVLSLISRPKEIIHAIGREIGGRAVGVWIADNTEMIYPASADPRTIVDAMCEARSRIHARVPIQIGMCVHTGRFYEIAGGLYGGDADKVEDLAENCAGPAEILLTDEMARLLRDVPPSALERREFDRGEDGVEPAWLLGGERGMPEIVERDFAYPHPFPREFFEALSGIHQPDESRAVKERIYSRWLREKVILFVAHHRGLEAPGALGSLLDNLVTNALMETIVRNEADADTIASSAGGLAIFTFEKGGDALEMARVVLGRLGENGIPARAAIDAGNVLLFRNPSGPSGIAGDPVNIASKLSEDAGLDGCICVSDRALRALTRIPEGERFETVVSRVQLTGLLVR
jgi:class 3 adenylate cyclase